MATADSSDHNAHRLPPEDWAYYAKQAGFTGDGIRDIVAIVMAESGGNVGAVGDGGDSVSALQINMPSHPQYDRQRLLTDPLYAMQAAYAISGKGKNFDAWTTWSHRTSAGNANQAQQYLDVATQATKTVETGYVPTPYSAPNATPAGVTTAGATTAQPVDITADTPPAQIEEYIRANYPSVAAFMTDPAIKMLLYAAAINNWDETKLDAAIEQTDYWKTHGPQSRDFDILLAHDPNEAGRLVTKAEGIISDLFSRNGVDLPASTLGDLAKQALRHGDITLQGQVMNPDGLNGMLAFGLGAGHQPLAGDAGMSADQLGAIARQYLVPVDRQTLEQWAVRIINGSATQDSFTHYVAGLAKGQWSNDKDVVAAIDSGVPPAQFFAPHRSLIAQTLEMAPEQVDLTDPRFRQVTQFFDGTQRRAMTLGEVEQWARHQDEFKNTRQYQQQAAETDIGLQKWLGRVAA